MTKALITGVTGMVGSHMADFLFENTDWEIHGICRWRSRMPHLRACGLDGDHPNDGR